MENVKKGTWVRIHSIALDVKERAANIPEDTRSVPLEQWTKGRLLEDAAVGDEVEVKTASGRIAAGKLVEVNPQYELNYGKLVPELIEIGESLRSMLWRNK
ncbi:MAG TPA: 2-amino-4-ketopentanoate thiolase [Tissierellia bacterium]|nr:2-amino-4-ketopentanoate thiolase [Tissierellia bacterium]